MSEEMTYDCMGSGGRCNFQQLREAVAEATCGDRAAKRTAHDDVVYIGHEIVGQINYNSLNRIVTAFVDKALTSPPAKPAPADDLLRKALKTIRDQDEHDIALDPDWPRRIAKAALSTAHGGGA